MAISISGLKVGHRELKVDMSSSQTGLILWMASGYSLAFVMKAKKQSNM